MASGRDDAYSACLATLRDTDFDRYLACLLAPAARRGPLAALYAFAAELARIRDLIREPLPGEVRLQYWRDLVEGQPHGDIAANPVAAGIERAVVEFRLPRTALSAMTEARIFDLYDDPMPDRATFEGYAGETASALIQLGTLILDPESAAAAAEAAGHAGIAQLVAGCLLLMPLHRRRRQVYLPGDILAAVGLDAEAFLDAPEDDRAAAAISAFIGYGRDHLRIAREKAAGLPKEARLAFLPVALAEPVFDRAERAPAAVLDRSAQPSQLARQWRLWRAGSRLF
ncbi:MAG: phytoene/squalene synthase family protein [Rhizobiaceae bacterium]|nr:phytoene/squalene synthase family protein [Rhizobiaceae bacterium]